ncbi:U32 family peptidase [Paenibacillus sp. ACRRX]|uniref:peptidase U32 family protein n=1 Tax=unclassified Paenibacillus TaxID=185978 RepID=UPI001EF6F554|nr:U32 family peptidase [Paenibacillus sp. UMB4589-SE434]MCG7408126.1 U32 family peptidase [Paenibacillus sp. ACRRX]MDK8181491.1 U32 family peptidase [Paenibacillus sp. UMB4589-SE434]
MARYFNGKEIELLAPAGTFEIFKSVIDANCDAVYFGGPSLNMRMMRKGYNLSYDEVSEAINMTRARGKRAYVTVNNLLNEEDLEEAKRYFEFLDKVGPDAIISQDLAVFPLIQQLNLNNIPVHSSVMMNVHNLEMIEAMRDMGVTRIVASREMDLHTAEMLQTKTGMEFEYFVHGDMCTVHGANCLYSAMLYGNSASRGRCMKPCRWDYRVKKDGNVYPTEYPLAAKDMYMYEHIPELIKSGITSFKLEGRMRDIEFLSMVINSYGEAIDRYIADPLGYNRQEGADTLYENRKRDFSTAYAFGKPGLDYINTRYEGTGKFYSTGKVFSTPTAEREMKEERLVQISDTLGAVQRQPAGTGPKPAISVHVNNMAQARVAIEEGADYVYLTGDVFQPDRPFNRAEIEQLTAEKGASQILLGMPRMMTEMHMEQYNHFLKNGANHNYYGLDGLLASNIGAMRKFRNLGLPMIADFCVNVYNHMSADVYRNQFNMERVHASLELPLNDLSNLLAHSKTPIEVIVHGSPIVMYLELDLYENAATLEPIAQEDNQYVDNQYLVLLTDKGENPIYRDWSGRNHLALAKELCYLPLLKELHEAGANHFRIEGKTYTPEQLRHIVRVYRQATEDLSQCGKLFDQMKSVYAGYTLGSLQFGTALNLELTEA